VSEKDVPGLKMLTTWNHTSLSIWFSGVFSPLASLNEVLWVLNKLM